MRLALASWVALLTISSSIPASAQDFAAEMAQLEQTVRMLRTAEEQATMVSAFVSLAERAFEVNEFSTAETAWNSAARLAQLDRTAAATYRAEAMRAREAGRAYARIRQHLDSEEPAARRQVAEFYGFAKRDWDRAMPGLAIGGDLIAQAAKLDMAHDEDEVEAVGDAWAAAARRYPTHAAALYARAGFWYWRVTNPTAALIRKMQTLGARIGYDPAPPQGAVVVNGQHVFGAQGTFGGEATLDKAFDGDINTYFDAPDRDAWVAIDRRTARPLQTIIYAARMPCSRWSQPQGPPRMLGGVFQVSNRADFAGVVTVHTIDTLPPMGQYVVVPITTPGLWRFVRYVAPSGAHGNIAEFQVR